MKIDFGHNNRANHFAMLLPLAFVLFIQRMAFPGLIFLFVPFFLYTTGLFILARYRDSRITLSGLHGSFAYWLIPLLGLFLPFWAMLIGPEWNYVTIMQLAHALALALMGVMIILSVAETRFNALFRRRFMSMILITAVLSAFAGLLKFVLRLYGFELMHLWYPSEYIAGSSIVGDYNFFALSALLGILALSASNQRKPRNLILASLALWPALMLSASRRGLLLGAVLIVLLLAAGLRTWIMGKGNASLQRFLIPGAIGLFSLLAGIAFTLVSPGDRRTSIENSGMSTKASLAEVTMLSYRYYSFSGASESKLAHFQRLWYGGDTAGSAAEMKEVFAELSFDESSAGTGEAGTMGRTARWRTTLDIFKGYTPAQKIFGKGFSYHKSFGAAFDEHIKIDYPHNPFLSVLLGNGFLGLIIAGLLLAGALILAMKIPDNGFILSALIASTIFAMLSGDGYFSIPAFAAFTYLPWFLYTGNKNE